MSESDKSPDLSKIISVLMENPDIIEKISSLAKTETKPQTAKNDTQMSERAEPAAIMSGDNGQLQKRERRSRLLSAIKPYLEPKRQEAIDSMMAIAEVLDTIKRR